MNCICNSNFADGFVFQFQLRFNPSGWVHSISTQADIFGFSLTELWVGNTRTWLRVFGRNSSTTLDPWPCPCVMETEKMGCCWIEGSLHGESTWGIWKLEPDGTWDRCRAEAKEVGKLVWWGTCNIKGALPSALPITSWLVKNCPSVRELWYDVRMDRHLQRPT